MIYPESKTNYKSIYQFIYKEEPELYEYLARSHRKHLRRKGGKKKHQPIFNLVDIENRPDTSGEMGYWESDLIIGKGRNALCVCTEKSFKMIHIVKIKDRSSFNNKDAIIKALSKYPSNFLKTITYDNGRENVRYNFVNKVLETDS